MLYQLLSYNMSDAIQNVFPKHASFLHFFGLTVDFSCPLNIFTTTFIIFIFSLIIWESWAL